MTPHIGERVELAGELAIARWWEIDGRIFFEEPPTAEPVEGEEPAKLQEHTVDVSGRYGIVTAMQPERGCRVDVEGDDVPAEMFFPWAAIRVNAIATPADLARAREVTAMQERIRAEVVDLTDRAKARRALAEFDRAIVIIKLLPLGAFDAVVDASAEAIKRIVHKVVGEE